MKFLAGIMSYKFALETMNTCIFNLLARSEERTRASVLWVTLQSINYGTQCLGSLIVGPSVQRVRTSRLLAVTLLLFGICITIVPVMELFSGGTLTEEGDWNPWILFIIYPLVGLFHGIIELIRRVIPNDIVGGDVVKLTKMNSTVHITYEIAGTSGALLATYWIRGLGFAYALFVMSGMFTIGSILWYVRCSPFVLFCFVFFC